MYVDHRLALRKGELAGALEQVCQALELTGTQEKRAEGHYTAVGEWLAESDDPMLQGVAIYVQGSTALGTTVRPLGRDEHDVDLVCFVPELGSYMPPAFLKARIGARLRQNGRYESMLEEKPRCWRLNYAGEFHMDITPAITNPACDRGGELVPDKKLRTWKSTNPRSYRALFEARANLQPRMRLFKDGLAEDRSAQASVEPYPSPMATKGILRRAVQLAKRNRDVHFAKSDPSLAPISVIITTLAARSYAYCVASFEFDSELDLLQSIIRFMPVFIEKQPGGAGGVQWHIPNETTAGENFAEKWNADPTLAKAFFEWHSRFSADLDRLVSLAGLDQLTKSLAASFGSVPAQAALDALTGGVSDARASGRLSIAPSVGLTVGAGVGSPMRRNTFYGA